MSTGEKKAAGTRRRLGGYELVRRLGRGSMGAVFLARQVSLDRKVALKVLAPRLAKNKSYVRRFLREAEVAAKLRHANVVAAIDVGMEGQYKFFVMEYAEGPTVADLLERGGAMDEGRALGIVVQVARALDHAHHNGLVHRDVKPANVILTRDGTAKLCDLGLAKDVEETGGDTQEGQALGTPDYISPEQARGEAVIDIRSDIYSLGASFYHMVTGQAPFQGPNAPVIMSLHITEEVPDPRLLQPSISEGVNAVIRKMLAKDRLDRQQTPEEVIGALESVAEQESAPPAPPLKGRRRPRRRRRF